MLGTKRRQKRSSIAMLVFALVVGVSNLAAADPEDELIALLLKADNVEATGIGPETIIVGWDDLSKVTALFRIEMSISETGTWETIKTVPCRTTNFSDANSIVSATGRMCATAIKTGPPSASGTRFIRVVPMIATPGLTVGTANVKQESLYEGTPTEPDPAILAPAAPTNLQCNGGGELSCVNVSSITLSWDDNSDEKQFWVMRAKGLVNPGYGVTPYRVLGANTTSFHEILPDFSQTYWYMIVAVRVEEIQMISGEVITERAMAASNTVDNNGSTTGPGNIKIDTPPIPPPTDPGGLTATFSAPSTAHLTWNDPQLPMQVPTYTDEDGWFVEFGTTPSDWVAQDTRQPVVGRGTVTFTDRTVPTDALRCYRVRGYRAAHLDAPAAFSGYTNTVCVGSIPKAPTKLTATAVSNAQVDLAWVDTSNTEQEFVVQRCSGTCSSSSTWNEIGATPTNIVTFSDTNTVASTTYSYRVLARNSSGASPSSNIVTVTTKTAPLPKVLNLVASPVNAHAIRLAWDDVLNHNETGYKVEYQSGSTWLELTVLSGFPGTSFEKEGGGYYARPEYTDRDTLRANQTRCYRVRAIKGVGLSDPSNTACATTGSALAPDGDPTGLTATPNTNTKATLAWNDNASNEDFYRVDYLSFPDRHCSDINVTPAQIDSGGIKMNLFGKAPARSNTGPTSFVAGGLIPHTAYFFRVTAVNLDGVSKPSNASGCVQTFGPAKPEILDEDGRAQENGDVDAMRCVIKVRTAATGSTHQPAPHPVSRLRIWVNAHVGEVAHTDTIYVPPLSQYPGQTAQYSVDSSGVWTIEYKFRKGPNYGIVATAFGTEPAYDSAPAGVRDVRVLADCPLDRDPLP